MSVIDTSLLIERVNEGKIVNEDITFITLIEYPMITEYKKFSGDVIYPEKEDLDLALELQNKLRKKGRMKNASDLIIAAICINDNEELLTNDGDFDDIADVSDLKVT